MSGPTVSLVLGSGGARGLAHIGVIRYLEESGYAIRSIAGCSIGAVVGGIYAAGKLDEYEKWVCAIDRVDLISLMDFSWQKSGLVKGDKIINALRELVGDCAIEDLPLSFTAVATDFEAEREVWIQSGGLFEAIRASMSLPLFFTPSVRNGRRLIDGGVLNPVPIAPTFSDNNDLTIAVNVSGAVQDGQANATRSTRQDPGPASREKAEDQEQESAFRQKVRAFVESLEDRLSSDAEEEEELDVLDIANQAFDSMQGAISRYKLAAYPPDKVITIARNVATVVEFHRAREIIDLGYREAGQQLGPAR